MANTQRFLTTMLPQVRLVFTCDIMAHLIGPDPKAPLSAFDVFKRAAELRGRANEAHVASCVQVVLVQYNWLEGTINSDTAHSDMQRALGTPPDSAE